VTPEAQARNSAPSSEHSKVEPTWLEVKVKVAVLEVVVAGSGGTDAPIEVRPEPTTSNVYEAGEASAFRLGSTARTRTVCWPASSPANSATLSGGAPAQSVNSGSLSSLHSKVASDSLLVKLNAAGVPSPILAGGLAAIVVSGAVWSSTVHSHVAAVVATSSCFWTAVTSKV
jgi:hypothetical protein